MKKQFIFSLVLLVLLCSCSKAKQITLSETDTVTFAITGGEKSIPVTADGSYDVKDCPDWVKAVASDSALIITVTQNTTGAPRKCIIRLAGKDIEVPIYINQADKCTYITPSVADITFPKEGGTQEIAIDTDGANIAVNCPEGIKASFADGKLTINVPTNQGGTIKGDITISCDDVTSTVKATVEGSICQRCGGKGTISCPSCRGKGYIDTGRDFYVGCSKCGGEGELDYDYSTGTYTPMFVYRKGSGRITCPDCGGKGR